MTQEIIHTLPESTFDFESDLVGGGLLTDRTNYIVKLKPGMEISQLLSSLEEFSVRFEKTILGQNSVLSDDGSVVLRLSLPNFLSERLIVDTINRLSFVAFAEVDAKVKINLTSTDTFYDNGIMWGMLGPAGDGIGSFDNEFGAHADVAWANAQVSSDGRVGDMTTVVGVIDSGIDPLHPDLYLNVWINQGEIAVGLATDSDGDGVITFRDLNQANGQGRYIHAVSDINANGYIDADDLLRDASWADGSDNDSNGFLDDLFGWDFFGEDNRPFEAYTGSTSPIDEDPSSSFHGTHVAGTFGSTANGTGVVGVTWDVQLMPLRFIGADGTGSVSDAVAAIDYYANLGQLHPDLDFVATNNSWGGPGSTTTLSAAIEAAGNLGHLFVAAAGNDSEDTDVNGHFPSNYEITSQYNGQIYDPVISVASLDSDGTLSSFSNFGDQTVDIGAPGGSIASTFAGDAYFGGYAYIYSDGTSMAAPHVAGALALLSSEFPDLTPAQLRETLLARVTPTASLDGSTVTGGRLNAGAMMEMASAAEAPLEPEIYIESKPVFGGSVHLYLVYRDIFGNEWNTRSGPEGGLFNFGDLIFEVNEPLEQSADARGNLSPEERNSTLLDLGAMSTDDAWARIVKYGWDLHDRGFNYQLTGINSNATIGAMLEAIDLDPETNLPDGVTVTQAVGFGSYSSMVTDTVPPVDGIFRLTESADVFTGIQIDEVIWGLGGVDVIYGGHSTDPYNNGRTGNDTILGGTGNDSIFGGDGDDELTGGADNDEIDGGADNDLLIDGVGSDLYIGGRRIRSGLRLRSRLM